MSNAVPTTPLLRLACEGRTTEWRDGPVRIGRAPDNQLVAEDASLSRHHVEIHLTRHGWSLRDLDSANGVWRGGTRVPNLVLRTGDEVLLGKCAIQVLEARTVAARKSTPVLAAVLVLACLSVWFAASRTPAPSHAPIAGAAPAPVPESPPGFGRAQSAAWVRAAQDPAASGADLAAGRLALVWLAQSGALNEDERRAAEAIDQRLDLKWQAGAAAFLRAAHVGDRGAAEAALRELYDAFPPADPRYGRVQALRREAP